MIFLLNKLLEIFDDKCLDMINKYFNKFLNTYNISIQFKMSILYLKFKN